MNDNIISRHLAMDVLEAPMQTVDKATLACIDTRGRGPGVDGFVDLSWYCCKNATGKHNTRFWVTTTDNPAYDAVLGKRDAQQCAVN